MSNNLWELATITFGIASIVGTSIFIICFNIAVYKRNKRIERKGYHSSLKNNISHEGEKTDEDEPIKKHSKLEIELKKEKKKKRKK